MSALRDKLIKNTKLKYTNVLSNSEYIGKEDRIPTGIPAIDIALSADIDGGLTSGITVFAGPSRHFKSGFACLSISAFQRKYPEGIILFFDSEFGMPLDYFRTFGINTDNVIHIPIVNIEELKFEMVSQLNAIDRSDKVMIVIDSVGNLASKKEANDALEGNDAQDMTRAKELKSFYRIITPYLKLKDIPMVVICHVYSTMEKFAKTVVSGGNGNYLAADTMWIIGRQQEKDGDEISGYKFVINIEKSRFVREKAKFPITVDFEKGISKWSGMFDIALEAGFIAKVNQGWYSEIDQETGELIGVKRRRGDLEEDDAFWKRTITPKFKEYIREEYKISSGNIIEEDTQEQLESE